MHAHTATDSYHIQTYWTVKKSGTALTEYILLHKQAWSLSAHHA